MTSERIHATVNPFAFAKLVHDKDEPQKTSRSRGLFYGHPWRSFTGARILVLVNTMGFVIRPPVPTLELRLPSLSFLRLI